jgi:hypothetical protein
MVIRMSCSRGPTLCFLSYLPGYVPILMSIAACPVLILFQNQLLARSSLANEGQRLISRMFVATNQLCRNEFR